MRRAKGKITRKKSGGGGYESIWIYVPSKIAKDRKIGGIIHSACSFFAKHPPEQLDDYVAKKKLLEFLES